MNLFIWLVISYICLPTPKCGECTETLDIKIPGYMPSNDDEYVCTAVRVPQGKLFVTGIQPTANMSVAHHILLYGCNQPVSTSGEAFACGSICRFEDKPKIIYAWGRQAPALILPRETAFEIGEVVGMRYLVLQVHYLHSLTTKDYSGITLQVSSKPSSYFAGIMLLLAYSGKIPPKAQVTVDISCQYNGDRVIAPFAFRTHAHALGRLIVAYLVSGKTGDYREIGRANPQWPQAFYSANDNLFIRPGDYLVARCYYDSSDRLSTTHMGNTHNDEMCNFYIMFSFKGFREASSDWKGCTSNQYPNLMQHIPKHYDPLPMTYQPMMEKDNSAGVDKITADANIWFDKEWKVTAPLGQVSGVSLTKENQLIVFHRASRIWTDSTFTEDFKIREENPIRENTVMHVDVATGNALSQWGGNLFYLPHGIYVDRYNGDVWITDVGAHTVMRFSANHWDKPSLVLGTSKEPGNDNYHFCQPANVVTNAQGDIFVADGYCNSRVVKFNSKGNYVKEWGSHYDKFVVVHSLTIVESLQWICVADRERASLECFDFNGNFQQRIVGEGLKDAVFAIQWDPVHQRILGVSINGELPQPFGAHGFAIDMQPTHNRSISQWNTQESRILSTPHDIAISHNGDIIFVAQLNGNNVCKFLSKVGFFPTTTSTTSESLYSATGHPRSTTGQAEKNLLPFSSVSNRTSVVIGLFLIVPVALILLIVLIIRMSRRRQLLHPRQEKFTVRRNRRPGKGHGFQPLRQEESDMEETLDPIIMNDHDSHDDESSKPDKANAFDA